MQHNRLITAFFDSRDDADSAVSRLVKAGLSRSEIKLVEGSSAGPMTSSSSTTSSSTYEDKGFWASLSEMFMPDEDRHTYAEGLNRGGYLVSVQVSDAQYERALDILDDDGTINIDERSASWRSQGWQGYQRPGSGTAGVPSSISAGAATSTGTKPTATSTPSASSVAGARRDEDVIPITEERLRVAKREENQGRVRVRSYVVETPVQEKVSLREEHVHVDRRPVDRPVTGAEANFKDRTIEATETAERAVVSKDARVVEEVAIRKDAQTRTETVSDKVRKTEVDIEDERNERTAGTATPKRPL